MVNKQICSQNAIEKILKKKEIKNKTLLLPNLNNPYINQEKKIIKKIKSDLDDSYQSDHEEIKAEEKNIKKINYFGYEKGSTDNEQYKYKRINDLLKLELNFLRKHEKIENNDSHNQQNDFSEIFYQFKKIKYFFFKNTEVRIWM